jgi:hypothetical protein
MMKSGVAQACALAFPLLLASAASAGVFSTSRFVNPDSYSIGFEPELTLTGGAGVAGNLRFTAGLSDLTNVTAIVGSGDGPRRFRVGGNMAFDFFPDAEGQPGIGIAGQAIYYRVGAASAPPATPGQAQDSPTSGMLELTAIPYVHKTFASGAGEWEPFLAVPFGVAFVDGSYQAISTLALGSIFKLNENFRAVTELGVAINNTETYFSGGVVYYH